VKLLVDTTVPGEPPLLTAMVSEKSPTASSPEPEVIATRVTIAPVNGNHGPGSVLSGVTVPPPLMVIFIVCT